MEHGEFLKLVQLVDANRKAADLTVLDVRDEDVEKAIEIDGRASSHTVETEGEIHETAFCPTCQGIGQDRAMLLAKLHSQGVDFPVDVWHPPGLAVH